MKTAALLALLALAQPSLVDGLRVANAGAADVSPEASAETSPSAGVELRFDATPTRAPTLEELARDLDEAVTIGEIYADERDAARAELAARPTLIVERTPGWVPWVIAGAAIASAILATIGTIAVVDAVSPAR